MKKNVLLLCLMAWFVIPHAQNRILYSSDSTRIKYATFNADSSRGISAEVLLVNLLRLDNQTSFVGVDTTYSPDSTFKHVKYVQYHDNYWVEHSQVVLTWHNDDIIRFNGYYLPTRNMSTTVNYSENDAISYFKQYYSISSNVDNVYASLLITNDDLQPSHPIVCYKVYGVNNDKILYLSALDLSVVKETNNPVSGFNSTLYTQYNGTQEANTMLISGLGYVLRDSEAAVEVVKCNAAPDYYIGMLDTYYNSSTIWGQGQNNLYPNYVLDAYWAASSFSYYLQNRFNYPKGNFQRYLQDGVYHVGDTNTYIYVSSIYFPDQIFAKKISYNAGFKEGSYPTWKNIIVIGAPGTLHNPKASIDETVHEFAHIFAIQEWNPSSDYDSHNEDQCLAEACSDIWAAIITHEIYPNNDNKIWKIGEDIVLANSGYSCVRNLANPVDVTAEIPMHSNGCQIVSNDPYEDSGVISHWFYLLTNGFAGTNCNGLCCDFTAIPIDSAAKLLYCCERDGYFYRDLTFEEICQATIDATENFSDPETIRNAVVGAWVAVGVKPGDTGIEQYGLDYNSDNTGNYFVDGDLVVNPLQTLTIKGTVFLSDNSSIVVNPSGKLIVDGGTLTSACAGEMWQGIEVAGDRTKHQTAANQGTVILRNGATIENAICGIRTGLNDDNIDFLTTGGIIYADSSSFLNCAKAVEFLSYQDFVTHGNAADNKSYFSNCTFSVDNDNNFATNNVVHNAHVSLWDVKGVSFIGCDFTETTTGPLVTTRGIFANDAGFRITPCCTVITQACQCPSSFSVPCSFSGFSTAVMATNTSPYSISIDKAVFTNNGTGVSVSSCDYVSVTRSEFNLSQKPGTFVSATGIMMDGVSGYKVEENLFHRGGLSDFYTFTGICVNNSGTDNQTLYRNRFKNLNRGIHVTGTNGNLYGGLQCACDTFSVANRAIFLGANSVVSPWQGSSSQGADNYFAVSSPNYRLYNGSGQMITYHYSNNTAFNPYPYYGILSPNGNVSANLCSSTLCGNISPIKTPSAGLTSLKHTYDSLRQVFEENDYAYVLSDNTADTYASSTQTTAQSTLYSIANAQKILQEQTHEALRQLMGDTVTDLNAIAVWLELSPGISSRYVEAEVAMHRGLPYGGILQDIATRYLKTDEEREEYDNYMSLHILKEALLVPSDGHVNWPAATPTQVAELQRIAEANTGRSSAMAKGVLCFFFDICYEEEEGETKGLLLETFRGTSLQDGTTGGLLVYPNPTDGTVTVEATGDSPIRNVTVLDMSGHVVDGVTHTPHSENSYICTLDLRHLDSGLYLIRALTADGKTVSGKVVRN